MILSWCYFNYYTPDSSVYIEIATHLPDLRTTIFPILYPVLLRLSAFVFGNYDFAAQLLNIILILFLFAFVKSKDFYWKEIWILFTFSSLQSIYPMIWSETLFLTIIILYSFYNFTFLTKGISSKKFIIINSFLLLLMIITKYSSIFFIGINFIFISYLIIVRNKKIAISYLLSMIISLLLFSVYFACNYILVGSFMGKRGVESDFDYLQYFFVSLKNIPLTYDPFSISIQRISIALKLKYDWTYITITSYMISYTITLILIFKFYRIKMKKYDTVIVFFILSSFTFLFLTFLSSYFTRIDIMDARLLLPFYVFLFICIIHFTHINKLYFKEKHLFVLGTLSLTIYMLNVIFCYFI